MGQLKKNITSLFLIPLLGIDKSLLKKHNFLNGYSYLKEQTVEYGKNVIYLLFKPPSPVLFQAFTDGQRNYNSFYIEDYNLDKSYIVVVYELPEEFTKDYELVRIGKYSLTSKAFQKKFPDSVIIEKKGRNVRSKTLQKLIFDKDPSLVNYWQEKIGTHILYEKDMEVWDSFESENETLDLEEIKKL